MLTPYGMDAVEDLVDPYYKNNEWYSKLIRGKYKNKDVLTSTQGLLKQKSTLPGWK